MHRSGEQGQALHLLQWLQAMGSHKLHIIHPQPRRFQLLGQLGGQRWGLGEATTHLGCRSRQTSGQRRGLLALGGGKATVAGAAGEPIGLPHCGAALNAQRQAQIRHHPPQDHQLLPILFAKQQEIRAHQGQQPNHHGGHPLKVLGPVAATEPLAQKQRRHHPGQAGLAPGVDLRHAGSKQGRGTGGGG